MLASALSRSSRPDVDHDGTPRVFGWPVVGALPAFLRKGGLRYMTDEWRRHGDIFRLRLGKKSVVAVVHPEAIERVLTTGREVYVKGKTYDMLRVLTGDGLLTLDGDPWRKRRRLAQPAFHKEAIRRLTDAMVRVTVEVLDGWRAHAGSGGTPAGREANPATPREARPARCVSRNGLMEAHGAMMHLALEIVGETLFGRRFSADESDGSARAFGEALELLSTRGNVPVPQWLPTPGNRRLRAALAHIDDMVYRIIREARTRERDARPTLLGMLLESRDADTGEALSDRALRDELITLVLAGHETTALLLTWAFTLLGRHPEVVARMRAEVRDVLGDRHPTAEDLTQLPYLRCVIDEVLRLRSPVWALGRDVAADDELCGHRVRAGEMVMPLPYLTHRHPAFWEEPARFDPDRFRPERKAGRHPFAYLPFSLGPRMCIGHVFTIVEAQIVLALLLQRCDLELASLREVPLKPQMTLRPAAPVHVRVRWHRTR